MTEMVLTDVVDADERRIVSPEGVPLTVRLADRGDRAAAFLIDLLALLLGFTLVAVSLVWLNAVTELTSQLILLAVLLVLFFLLRSFYFTYFELRWRGSTPGKRLLGLRVIDNNGGPLLGRAVVARNMMREVEFFLPAGFLFQIDTSSGQAALFYLLVSVWLGILVLLPLFNRDRMRAGDLVGGTWVISVPKTQLLDDLSPADTSDSVYAFSADQLGIYGVYELQVLEDILRKESSPAAAESERKVFERIAEKIAWTPPAGHTVGPRRFLEAFYAAQRAHLEHRMLFGQRRASKHDRNEAGESNERQR